MKSSGLNSTPRSSRDSSVPSQGIWLVSVVVVLVPAITSLNASLCTFTYRHSMHAAQLAYITCAIGM